KFVGDGFYATKAQVVLARNFGHTRSFHIHNQSVEALYQLWLALLLSDFKAADQNSAANHIAAQIAAELNSAGGINDHIGQHNIPDFEAAHQRAGQSSRYQRFGGVFLNGGPGCDFCALAAHPGKYGNNIRAFMTNESLIPGMDRAQFPVRCEWREFPLHGCDDGNTDASLCLVRHAPTTAMCCTG